MHSQIKDTKDKAINTLNSYAKSLEEKGLEYPKPQDYRHLALLSISWLEDEYVDYKYDDQIKPHRSINNIPENDKNFKAACFLLRLETKNDDNRGQKSIYCAYDNYGKKIMEMTSIREMVKRLKKYFDGNYSISERSVEKELQNGNLDFDWGYLEVINDYSQN